MRYVVHVPGRGYLTPRRATSRVYKDRATWTEDLDDARVFQNKSGAVTAARGHLHDTRDPAKTFDVISVSLVLGPGETKDA